MLILTFRRRIEAKHAHGVGLEPETWTEHRLVVKPTSKGYVERLEVVGKDAVGDPTWLPLPDYEIPVMAFCEALWGLSEEGKTAGSGALPPRPKKLIGERVSPWTQDAVIELGTVPW